MTELLSKVVRVILAGSVAGGMISSDKINSATAEKAQNPGVMSPFDNKLNNLLDEQPQLGGSTSVVESSNKVIDENIEMFPKKITDQVEFPKSNKLLTELAEKDGRLFFVNTGEALGYLEGEKGAKWISGKFNEMIDKFPKESDELWNIFSNLRSVGNEPHEVILVPNSNDDGVSVFGVEMVGGDTVLDFVNLEGDSESITVEGVTDHKTLLGDSYSEWYILKTVTVWPNLDHPNGDAKENGPNPVDGVPGVFEGWTRSTSGENSFYYQYSRAGN